MGGTTSEYAYMSDEQDFDASLFVTEETPLDEVHNIRQAFVNCGMEVMPMQQVKVVRFK